MSTLTRKHFLHLAAATAGSATLAAVGCGDDPTTSTGGGGSGNTSNTGGSGNTGNDGGSGNTGNTGNNGGDGGTPGTGGNPAGGGMGNAGACSGMGMLAAAISNPHGHTLMIPESDIAAGVDVTYTTTGGATHTHQVTITAADFAALRNGDPIAVFTCNGGDHQYVFSCSANPPAPMFPVPGC